LLVQTLVHDAPRPYTGGELRSHYIYETFDLAGDATAAFVGPCEVATGALVDLDDVRDGAHIYSPLMLHVLVEQFDGDLRLAICRQRLLVVAAAEQLALHGNVRPHRVGDDLFVDERKLTVSIATASPVSTLIHLGINVESEGAPVPAIGLAELAVDPFPFARDLLDAWRIELEGMAHARVKVRPVS
jgi:hypothetical protein